MSNPEDIQVERLEGAKFLCRVPPGGRVKNINGTLVVTHPDFPPQIVTAEGLKPLDTLDGKTCLCDVTTVAYWCSACQMIHHQPEGLRNG